MSKIEVIAIEPHDGYQPGNKYPVSEAAARQLIQLGLVKMAGPVNNKMAVPLANKIKPPLANKANPSPAAGKTPPSSVSPAAQVSPPTTRKRSAAGAPATANKPAES